MQTELVLWILLLPFLGFLFHALLGGTLVKALGAKTGKWVIGFVASGVVLGACGLSLQLFQQMQDLEGEARHATYLLTDWMKFGQVNVPFEFVIDPLSVLMCLIITGIGGLIHVYATGYMADDEDYPRFFTYFNLFILFMLVLVLANNFVLMFIGWEGVGLCSYLLIGYFYRNSEWKVNTDSANKAFIVNRIGDFGFVLAMFIVFVVFGTFSFDTVNSEASTKLVVNSGIATALALLLFLAAAGKSAQLPLYFWLPDAMAGPTPVSALIHAATMVTAGVYMLTRVHPLFEMAPDAMMWVAGLGAATAIFAATVALAQTDIKRVLAYSTVSQLGFMFLACGVGAFWVGMFHVATHAFFKALLFLGAGSVLIALHHQQDLRQMGGLMRSMPITGLTMIVGLLAISGVPPLSGYWSKDLILAHAHSVQFIEFNQMLFWVGVTTAVLTALYMTRMLILTFFGQSRWEAEREGVEGIGMADASDSPDRSEAHSPHERYWTVLGVLVVLAAGSVAFGWFLPTEHAFEEFLKPAAEAKILTEGQLGRMEESKSFVQMMAIGAAILGIVAGLLIYRRGMPKPERELSGLWGLAHRQWGYDGLMSLVGVRLGGAFANFCRGVVERAIDGVVNGVGAFARLSGSSLRHTQTGYVRDYAMTMLIGAVILLVIIFWIGRH
jgi:NADH-quinone oxidoreductase subunit L